MLTENLDTNNEHPVSLVRPEAPAPSAWEQHNQFQREIIAEMAGRIAMGAKIDPAEIEAVVCPKYNNSLIRGFAIKNGICTKGSFAEIIRKVKIKDELGTVPQSATDLVRIVVKRDTVACKFDGMLSRTVVPYMLDEKTGAKSIVAPNDYQPGDMVDLYVQFHFPKDLNFMDFERELRILNDDLRLGFTRDAIADALTQWYETAKKTRLHDLFHGVGSCKAMRYELESADAQWKRLAENIFDTSHDSADFIIAVLKKFIWQVKRKIRGLPVTNHLMPVILGPQGVGKSTFVNLFIEPLRELALEVDFKMIEDDRNIDIWESFILFLDEMGYASKANVDSIKHAITATHLSRRPMRTNKKVSVKQNATFIGCSNKVLAQLIKDPTGIRRFVGTQFSTKPCRETMNSLDYGLLWRSVHVDDADPMSPFIALLTAKQDEDREKGRVEEWLAVFNPNDPSPRGDYGTPFSAVAKGNRITASDLFVLYSEWEGVMYPGSYNRLNAQEFGHEMKRLLDNSPEKVPFTKGTRSSKGVTWVYSGPHNIVSLQRGGYGR